MINYYLAACGHYVPANTSVIKCQACATEKARKKCENHIVCDCSKNLTIEELVAENEKLREALAALERASEHAMMADDLVRSKARALLGYKND